MDKGPSFAGRCGNVHVHSRCGKIEERAGKRKGKEREGGGRVLFLPSVFHYFLFPINTSIFRSQQTAQGKWK